MDMTDRSDIDIVDRLQSPKWRVSHDLNNPSNPVQPELVVDDALQDMKVAASEIKKLRGVLKNIAGLPLNAHTAERLPINIARKALHMKQH